MVPRFRTLHSLQVILSKSSIMLRCTVWFGHVEGLVCSRIRHFERVIPRERFENGTRRSDTVKPSNVACLEYAGFLLDISLPLRRAWCSSLFGFVVTFFQRTSLIGQSPGAGDR